jgi:hypothetical protein
VSADESVIISVRGYLLRTWEYQRSAIINEEKSFAYQYDG